MGDENKTEISSAAATPSTSSSTTTAVFQFLELTRRFARVAVLDVVVVDDDDDDDDYDDKEALVVTQKTKDAQTQAQKAQLVRWQGLFGTAVEQLGAMQQAVEKKELKSEMRIDNAHQNLQSTTAEASGVASDRASHRPAAEALAISACWKIGQDILIRIRRRLAYLDAGKVRPSLMRDGAEGGHDEENKEEEEEHKLLTKSDAEFLNRRLRDIRDGLGLAIELEPAAAPESKNENVRGVSTGISSLYVVDGASTSSPPPSMTSSQTPAHAMYASAVQETQQKHPEAKQNDMPPNTSSADVQTPAPASTSRANTDANDIDTNTDTDTNIEINNALLQDFLLEALRFKSMEYREHGIAQAHGTSFEWIYNEPEKVAVTVQGQSHEAQKQMDESVSFRKWLSTTELGNIYWITGKPGSGKSTLMRYLATEAKTLRLLRTWAGPQRTTRLLTAGFYFWTSGSEEQRSQTGLLRSLLYQLLSAEPGLIARAFPDKWRKLGPMTSKQRVAASPLEWSIGELANGLRGFLDGCGSVEGQEKSKIGGNQRTHTKICLFVDGLDEFDGDHETIIHFFRDLAQGKHAARIKLCLSSRPWPVFERAFDGTGDDSAGSNTTNRNRNNKVPNLKLQASTAQDMLRYTIDKLTANDHVREIMLQDVDVARKLVETVVTKASGVFLWVRLAVRELVCRFGGDGSSSSEGGAVDADANENNVRIGYMRDWVLSLPTDLDDLFEVFIFKSQSADALVETARLFRLVRAREIAADFVKNDAAGSLSLWELAFARNGQEDDKLALERAVQQEEERSVAQRCNDTEDWALRRSVGLLEVQQRGEQGSRVRGGDDATTISPFDLAQYQVTYLHRTVRDWLLFSANNNVWKRLEGATEAHADAKTDTFDPHLRLLRSYILLMKHPIEEPEHHRRLDEWYPGITLALTSARYIVRDPQHLETRFINELDKTISWYWRAKESGMRDHWARNCFGTYEERKGSRLVVPYPFLALCTKLGLQRYVLDTLESLAQHPPESNVGQIDDEELQTPAPGATSKEADPVEETPLIHRALEFLCSRQKTIFPLSDPSFVRLLLQASQKYSSNPALRSLVGTLNENFTSVLLKRKDVTVWILTLRHLRDAKRRRWIEPFETDKAGTWRWASIVECLIQEGGADKAAVIRRDVWDPEVSAAGVMGRDGLLGTFGDYWVEQKLVPLFGNNV